MNDNLTTAKCRKLAQATEKQLDWRTAAFYWAKAIELYPTAGGVARVDIERMRARQFGCQQMREDGL